MNDTAMIIASITALIGAIAGLVTATGVPLTALSKWGPFTKEVNKMLADQHKRSKDAKSKIDIQNSPSQTARNRKARLVGITAVIVGACLPLIPAFASGTSAVQAVVICSSSLLLSMIGLSIVIIDILLETMAMLSNGTLEGMTSLAEMIHLVAPFRLPSDQDVQQTTES